MAELYGLVLLALLALGPEVAESHGRMVEPASRNAMWRYGYKTPRNYNDMGQNCGGFPVSLWSLN